MSIYDRASDWFSGLDGLDRTAVLALGGKPLPGWVAESLELAGIRTVPAEVPIGTGYRSVEFMTTVLSDFLTHEALALDVGLRADRSTPAPAAA
ncbi:MAG: hypothetical protein JWM34_562 [Ilumatobacteraceae bacterium]|nr:hypothetical protein [Ilumatobacteraceae bacterium]